MDKTPEPVTSAVPEDGEMGADVVLDEKKGTVSDVEDMRRMGKQQLFRVRAFSELKLVEDLSTKLPFTAQFWLLIHLWVCHDSYEYLGSSARVRSCFQSPILSPEKVLEAD
jgi:hypothetical protein